VVLGQVVGELLIGGFGKGGLLPEVRGQVRVGLRNGGVCGLGVNCVIRRTLVSN
jgi:hypothetical protein